MFKKKKKPLVIESGPIKYRIGHKECIGPRPTMEDATVILGNTPCEGYSYFAIFDGHGGTKVSHYAGKHIHESFQSHFQENQDSNVMRALDQAVQGTNRYLVKRWKTQGSVIGVILVSNDKIYSYNIGDVRAIIVYPDGKVQRLSHDHRACDPKEEKIIRSYGGFVLNDRLQGVLEISRTLGDGEFKRYICTEPFVSECQRVDGAKVVLACDGVWDVMGDPTAAKIAFENDDPSVAASAIVDQAIKNHTTDNVSCIVIDLTPI